MYLIGICGRSGSGKSTVAGILVDRGAAHIDADAVCHRVYESNDACIAELCRRFGSDVVVDGKIHRPTLATRAYGEEGGTEALNAIAHKYIIEDMDKEIERYRGLGKTVVLLDAPLLFEAGLDGRCDGVIAVVAPYASQLNRLSVRDGRTVAEIERRLSAQLPVKTLVKRSDAVVVNDGSLALLRKRTLRCMLALLLRLGGLRAEGRRIYAYRTR